MCNFKPGQPMTVARPVTVEQIKECIEDTYVALPMFLVHKNFNPPKELEQGATFIKTDAINNETECYLITDKAMKRFFARNILNKKQP